MDLQAGRSGGRVIHHGAQQSGSGKAHGAIQRIVLNKAAKQIAARLFHKLSHQITSGLCNHECVHPHRASIPEPSFVNRVIPCERHLPVAVDRRNQFIQGAQADHLHVRINTAEIGKRRHAKQVGTELSGRKCHVSMKEVRESALHELFAFQVRPKAIFPVWIPFPKRVGALTEQSAGMSVFPGLVNDSWHIGNFVTNHKFIGWF
ncbi:MAG: hypothetical protein V4710_10865 [Verrucomicrobiota bacterium]